MEPFSKRILPFENCILADASLIVAPFLLFSGFLLNTEIHKYTKLTKYKTEEEKNKNRIVNVNVL